MSHLVSFNLASLRCLTLSSALLLLGACGGTSQFDPNGLNSQTDAGVTPPTVCQGPKCCTDTELICAGDPDGKVTCTCYKQWTCDSPTLPQSCYQQPFDAPDGNGGWSCAVQAGKDICIRPSNVPPGKNGWVCIQTAYGVRCERPVNTPDGTGTWDCTVVGTQKQCQKTQPPAADLGVPPPTPDSGTPPPVCNETQVEFAISHTTADMLIVLDRSNSMDDGSAPLWDSCRSAIYDITGAMQSQIWFGLSVFPNSSGAQTCTASQNVCAAPTAPLVSVGANEAADIQAALVNMKVCGGTPTAQSLAAAKQYLSKLTADNHPKYVLLATDGGPNCNAALDAATCTCTPTTTCVGAPGNCIDDLATYQALDDLCAAGIRTYVVGLGSDPSLTMTLQGMAQHGCTGNPYAPSDPAAIKKDFTSIAGSVTQCTFQVNCADIPDPSQVNFYFDGNLVQHSTSQQVGWDWTTSCAGKTGTGTVQFFGLDCDSIKTLQVTKVSAKFGCPTT